ncbi:MAG: hypothetical protein AAGA71_15720 [Pseudomonadota bacterium]
MKQLSDELLDCAKKRLSTEVSSITESDLRRAQSDLYYAVFHAICSALVEPLNAVKLSKAFSRIYVAIYRYPDHGKMEQHARKLGSNADLPREVRRTAQAFVDLKNKRQEADYNPLSTHENSIIRNDIQKVETLLRDFWSLSDEVRIDFALQVTRLER